MRNRRQAIFTAAIAAICPAVAHAATITISFGLNDITISKISTGPYVSPATVVGANLAGTPAAPVLTVPAGISAISIQRKKPFPSPPAPFYPPM